MEHSRHAHYVFLSDLMMHGTNGWEFRAEQLPNPRLVGIPVVVCPGDGRLKDKALALGIVEYSENPIVREALLASVARHCHTGARRGIPTAAR